MADNKERESLISKIRKLRAKANDKSVTEAEAAAFAAKVQTMLIEHGLALSDVEMREKSNAVGGRTVMTKGVSPARKVLMWAVCRHFMCEALRYKTHWQIIGRPHNVEVALEIFDYLLGTTIRLSNDYARTTRGNAIDFRRGCMTRLAERLDSATWEAKRKEQRAQAAQPSGSNLPAIFTNESALVAEFVKATVKVKEVKVRVKHGLDAYRGREAANKIPLSKQAALK